MRPAGRFHWYLTFPLKFLEFYETCSAQFVTFKNRRLPSRRKNFRSKQQIHQSNTDHLKSELGRIIPQVDVQHLTSLNCDKIG